MRLGQQNAQTQLATHRPLHRRFPTAYLYILPIVLIVIVFRYVPFLRTALYAFSKVNARGEILEFVGLKNFQDLFKNRTFIGALKTTLTFTAAYVALIVASALLTARCATPENKFNRLMTVFIMLPMLVSMSSIAMVMKLLLNPGTGYINYLFGLNWSWFQDRHQALWSVLLVVFWMGFPFAYLVLRSALFYIPSSLIEAAKLDGATSLQIFYKVELPLISPQILTVFSLSSLGALLMAGPVMVLTEGGPLRSTTTLIFMMFTSGYQSSNYALSASIALFTFALSLLFTILIFQRGRVHYA